MRRDMVVSRYAILIGIPRVDGLSMRPLGFGALHYLFFGHQNNSRSLWMVYMFSLYLLFWNVVGIGLPFKFVFLYFILFIYSL